MIEEGTRILYWCPYHATLLGYGRVYKRQVEICCTKPYREWRARFTSFRPVVDIISIPEEIVSAADAHNLILLHNLTYTYRKSLVAQMRKEIPKTYWNGSCLSYTRISLFFARRWNSWRGV